MLFRRPVHWPMFGPNFKKENPKQQSIQRQLERRVKDFYRNMDIRRWMQYHNLPVPRIRWENVKAKRKMSKFNAHTLTDTGTKSIQFLSADTLMTMKKRQHQIWHIFRRPEVQVPTMDRYFQHTLSLPLQQTVNSFFAIEQQAEASESSDEEDPLDAFMMGLEKTIEKEKMKGTTDAPKATKAKSKGVRGDIDDEDDEESYYRYVARFPIGTIESYFLICLSSGTIDTWKRIRWPD